MLKKKYTQFRPKILSRHPSHSCVRRKKKNIKLLPFKSVVRFGSSTSIRDTVSNGGDRIELNTINAIKNSSSKLLMKECFSRNDVKTAIWSKLSNYIESRVEENGRLYAIFNKNDQIIEIEYPLVGKSHFGSRNRGNTKIDTPEEFELWRNNKINYIVEKFYNYNKEYRLHIDREGCFYTCRKMIKKDTPDNQKWYKNNDNSVWILEENQDFEKPNNWDLLITESVKALNSVGLDVGAVDLRIQNNNKGNGSRRENPDFIILEINSAPSFGEVTAEKYKDNLPRILTNKYNGK